MVFNNVQTICCLPFIGIMNNNITKYISFLYLISIYFICIVWLSLMILLLYFKFFVSSLSLYSQYSLLISFSHKDTATEWSAGNGHATSKSHTSASNSLHARVGLVVTVFFSFSERQRKREKFYDQICIQRLSVWSLPNQMKLEIRTSLNSSKRNDEQWGWRFICSLFSFPVWRRFGCSGTAERDSRWQVMGFDITACPLPVWMSAVA